VDVSEAAEFSLFAVGSVDQEPVLIVNNMPPIINDGVINIFIDLFTGGEGDDDDDETLEEDVDQMDDMISVAEDDGDETHVAGDT